MANQEHLDILKQGVEMWNQWRRENPGILPDLSGADLSKANIREINLNGAYLYGSYFYVANLSRSDLRAAHLLEAKLNWANLSGTNLGGANLSQNDLTGADLTGADLREANLTRAYLRRADLNKADLREAHLRDAHLKRADLRDADLNGADLEGADLDEANLRRADLREANLSGADLTEADLSETDLMGATIGWTIFGTVDLSTIKGLDTINHVAPSTIGIDTIYRSRGNIPEVFLRGAGVDDTFITYIRSFVSKPIEYYSCFISYSNKDEAFAKQLYADLQSNNVRCWFAPEDLKWGARTRHGIDEAIRIHDKLLLILSKHSVASGWVEHEVKTALARERKEKRTVLFPVRIDQTVLDSPLSWATEIRHERNIGDFARWKNHDVYEKAFA